VAARALLLEQLLPVRRAPALLEAPRSGLAADREREGDHDQRRREKRSPEAPLAVPIIRACGPRLRLRCRFEDVRALPARPFASARARLK
jgi:hypothetical protein